MATEPVSATELAPLRARLLESVGIHIAGLDERALSSFARHRAGQLALPVSSWVSKVLTDGTEWERLLAAVTNGHTWFYRERAALDVVVQVLTEKRTRTGKSGRVWCAGCSTGQEAWSVAMACADAGVDVEILATDVSPAALAAAREGVYEGNAARGLPPEVSARYTASTAAAAAAGLRISPALRTRVRFVAHSIVDPLPADALGDAFDVVICRNVLIYFAPAAAARALANLASTLVAGGVLVLGAAEGLHGERTSLTRTLIAGRVVHQREGSAPSRVAPSSSPSSSPQSAPFLPGFVPTGHGIVLRETFDVPAEAPPPAPAAPAATEDPLECLARGHALLSIDRVNEAARCYDEARTIDALYWEAHLFLGIVERRRARFDAAATHLERALFLEPRAWVAALLLVGCYERSGRTEAAAREQRRARRLLDEGGAPLPAGAASLLPDLDEAVAALMRS